MSWADSNASQAPAPNAAPGRPAWQRRALAAGLVLAAAIIAAMALGASGPLKSSRVAYPAAFPAGPGQEIAEQACLICHSAMLVTQQAKDSTGWEKTIVQMKLWGAPLTPAEHDTLRGYLLTHFGPRGAAH